MVRKNLHEQYSNEQSNNYFRQTPVCIYLYLMQDTVTLTSILDNDFYKFTMQHGVITLYPKAKAKYEFINRGRHSFPAGFASALQRSVNTMAALKLTNEEKKFLRTNCPYLSPTYLDFLQGYCYNPDEVIISQIGDQVNISVEGYWYRTILWEVPILCLISETWYKLTGSLRKPELEIKEITAEKIRKYNQLGITIAEFGTRRRHSYQVHRMVMETLKEQGNPAFVGTSNVHFAMLNNVKPIGTHAHEWFMFHAAKYGFKMANTTALENWVAVYRGDLGIALSDTYTSTVFYKQFDKMFTKLFDGVRHDSGDAIEFAEQTINHYTGMGIDPLSKTIIFSDGLNYEKVNGLLNSAKEKLVFHLALEPILQMMLVYPQ